MRTRTVENAMHEKTTVTVVDRRDFIAGVIGTAALAALLGRAGLAHAQDRPIDSAALMKSILGDAKPAEGRVALDLPEIAENGNTVPYTITVESPMTEQDFVKAVHIVSTANVQPQVASFFFTPMSGKAGASSRMRLGQTQDIIAIAELSDGRFHIGKRAVKVTIGGCGG